MAKPPLDADVLCRRCDPRALPFATTHELAPLTERVGQARAEEALQQSEMRFRDLVENTSDLIWEWDAQGRYVYCSPALEGTTGMHPEQLLGHTFLDVATPEEWAARKPVLDDLRKFGRVNKPVRPWLGLYSTEIEDKIVIVGIAPKGPAARAELKTGDVVLSVAGEDISTLVGQPLSTPGDRCNHRGGL